MSAINTERRARLLRAGLSSGALPKSAVGAQDAQILLSADPVGSSPSKAMELNKFLADPFKPGGGISGFFGNLGNDITNTAAHIPGGIFETGKAVAKDIAGNPSGLANIPGFMVNEIFGGDTEVHKKVVAPAVAQEKYQWGPLFHGHGKEFLRRFQAHPLGPILDLATVASLGIGGAARGAQLAGSEGRVANLISREGRRPIPVLGADAQERAGQMGLRVPEIPREYSTRPLRHIGQMTADRLIAGRLGRKRLPLPSPVHGGRASIQELQSLRAINRLKHALASPRRASSR
jgi:hypothetical protein